VFSIASRCRPSARPANDDRRRRCRMPPTCRIASLSQSSVIVNKRRAALLISRSHYTLERVRTAIIGRALVATGEKVWTGQRQIGANWWWWWLWRRQLVAAGQTRGVRHLPAARQARTSLRGRAHARDWTLIGAARPAGLGDDAGS
jgi:hypothetical protein